GRGEENGAGPRMRLLRLWFGLSERVGRRDYFVSGAGLMVLKYAIDSLVVWSFTGRWWTPLDYATPLITARQRVLAGVPAPAVIALAILTLPFLWVGVSMTMRRAVDAGMSAWIGLLFFVPFIN